MMIAKSSFMFDERKWIWRSLSRYWPTKINERRGHL